MTPIWAFLFAIRIFSRSQERFGLILLEARSTMIEGGIITLDLNGVPEGTFEKQGSLRSFVT
jgi:hypothetical protein